MEQEEFKVCLFGIVELLIGSIHSGLSNEADYNLLAVFLLNHQFQLSFLRFTQPLRSYISQQLPN